MEATWPREESTEAPLLTRLRSGDAEAFEELVRTHSGRMLSVARRYLDCEQDARDAVQEALVSAFKAIGDFNGNSQLSTWLHRIVVNCALMKLRSRGRRPEECLDDLLPTFDETGHRVEPGPAWCEHPEEKMERTERAALVRRCIMMLPAGHRNVLMLRDIEELDTEETARVLGITENAAKIRLHRARQALRTLLDPHFQSKASH